MEGRQRQMTKAEQLKAQDLRRQGHSYSTIAAMLSEEATDKRRFDRATVYRACKKLPAAPEDERYEWQLMEECGLPDEASSFILEMLSWVREGGGDLDLDQLPEIARPTIRTVRWWWRVHMAAPGLDLRGVYTNAEQFAVNERVKEVLDWEVEMEGLWWYLCYTPWASPDHYARYKLALEEGRIPRKVVARLHRWQQVDEFTVSAISLTNPPTTGEYIDQIRVVAVPSHAGSRRS